MLLLLLVDLDPRDNLLHSYPLQVANLLPWRRVKLRRSKFSLPDGCHHNINPRRSKSEALRGP